MSLLKIIGISKSYNSIEVFKNLNFEIGFNESVAILGKSGCGKTTIVKIVCGLIQQTTGSLEFNFNPDLIDQEIFMGIGYVPQSPSLLNTKSVIDNILLPLKITGIKNNKVDELISLLGLKGFEHKYPQQLSRGQQQRVSLARAMILKPSLLVLDEPFASIDEISKEGLDTELLKLKSTFGISMLIVTHSIEEAIYVADKVIIINNKQAKHPQFDIDFTSKQRNPNIKSTKKFFSYQNDIREAL